MRNPRRINKPAPITNLGWKQIVEDTRRRAGTHPVRDPAETTKEGHGAHKARA